jgi:hypothetical protein
VSHGQNVTVDVTIGSKCHCGRSELGRNVQAAFFSPVSNTIVPRESKQVKISLVKQRKNLLRSFRETEFRQNHFFL